MPTWPIASGQHAKDRRRREHLNHDAARPRYLRVVTLRRPAQQHIAAHGESRAIQHDEGAVRQIVDGAAVPTLGPTLQAFAVKQAVHLRGARRVSQTVRPVPVFGKAYRVLAAAFETGPVPGGECGRLVKKEQLSIEPPPYIALTTFKCEHATDPLPRRPASPCERAFIGMKPAAAIAHQRAARRVGKKLAERIDAILQRHCRSPAGWS